MTYLVGYKLLSLDGVNHLKLAVPNSLELSGMDKTLIVRDYSIQNVFRTLTKYFNDEFKVSTDNIKSACITYEERPWVKAADYFCFTAIGDIWFPWGKTL